VPRRNTVLLAIASAIAEQRGLQALVYGAHKTDSAYPDCTPTFAIAFRMMLREGSPDSSKPLGLWTPIMHFTKQDVVELAEELEVPVALTHSCYQGRRPACGVCDTCQIRIAAFKAAGFIDPIEYEIDIDWGDCILWPGEEEEEDHYLDDVDPPVL
jgi:7-cyano-7-deazaguanine synthase